MALENKLGIDDSAELAREEERISKKKAMWLFESGTLDTLPVGTLLAKPQAELNERLLQFRKIWDIQVMVLNEKLAREYKLIC